MYQSLESEVGGQGPGPGDPELTTSELQMAVGFLHRTAWFTAEGLNEISCFLFITGT